MNNKANPILLLRGIACLVIFIWHVGLPKEYLLINNINLSWITVPSGIMALWIFFILSGYLNGKNFYQQKYFLTRLGISRFFFNRLIKVAPLYYFNMIFLSLVIYPEVWRSGQQMLLKLFSFTANDFLSLWYFNANLWAVSTEVQFYLCVPLFFYFLSKLPKELPYYLLSLCTILFVGLFIRLIIFYKYQVYNSEKYIAYIYTPLITNIDFFLFGFLLNPIIKISNNFKTLKFPEKYFQIFKTTLLIILLV